MTFNLREVTAEAARLWRSERGLLTPLAGMFYMLPMLGLVLMMAGLDLSPDAGPEAMRAAIGAFYNTHLIAIVAVNIAIDFGTFAILNLYLQGGGRTVGEVLALTARRFPQFVVIDILAGLFFALGLSLFVLPGLLVFARTWLAGPAISAAPERGIIDAFRQGWVRSSGLAWALILFACALALVAGVAAVVLASTILGVASALSGGGQVLVAVGYLVVAVLGAMLWTMLVLLRLAFYRLSVARQGM